MQCEGSDVDHSRDFWDCCPRPSRLRHKNDQRAEPGPRDRKVRITELDPVVVSRDHEPQKEASARCNRICLKMYIVRRVTER